MPRISAANLSEHRAQTLERIFEAISRLSRDRAIDDISMTDVAAAAGVARTVLYNYFPDKGALLLAFSERVTDYFIERYERELPVHAPAAERLTAFVRLQLNGLQAHPHPGPVEMSAALGPEAYQALAGHVAPMQEILSRIIAAGVASGEFRRLDPAAAARSVMAVIGAERIPLIRGQVTPDEAEHTVNAFVQAALKNS
ncbi:TetR/AcrR family transcriptional regulator [Nonomuraea sp. NPDC048916]|uniref:TetR/AcrR family transcriptional regulator n=1 Tax=Nonomuraea sp. NPDC048916 TaxID=3154232 RepID=UPI0033FA74C1